MALPAAIALSGLKEDCFSDGLNDVFSRGAVLLKSPSLSSLTSSEDALSQESGISSMSSGTSVIRSLGPFFEMLVNSQQIELKSVSGSDTPSTSRTPSSTPNDEPPQETSTTTIPATNAKEHTSKTNSSHTKETIHKTTLKIVYQNRDILNMGSNIKWNFSLRPAELHIGQPSFFFKNRSQYSRLLGAHIPEHDVHRCLVDDCDFEEVIYKE